MEYITSLWIPASFSPFPISSFCQGGGGKKWNTLSSLQKKRRELTGSTQGREKKYVDNINITTAWLKCTGRIFVGFYSSFTSRNSPADIKRITLCSKYAHALYQIPEESSSTPIFYLFFSLLLLILQFYSRNIYPFFFFLFVKGEI